MVSMPAALSARCRSSRLLRPACPGLIPRVTGALTVSEPGYSNGFAVFDLQYGAPKERRTRLNRPPGVLHLTVVAGPKPSALFGGMAFPGSKSTARLENGLDVGTRRQPLIFGARRWGGHAGSLFLAPSYPFGGQIGGHLTFWWQRNGTGYVVSLHAWEPLTECARVLEAIVAATR
jgi:hypothetical protein